MSITLGVVGAGDFSDQFTELFQLHPEVREVFITDLLPERARSLEQKFGLAGTFADFDAMLASNVDAVAIFTQRWQHGPLVVKALRAGKHVYSAVPMAISEQEIADIVRTVEETGLTYMMGETSFHNPAAIFARQKLAEGAFGEVFYSEGDYVHDIDEFRGFKRTGGESWRALSSFPPMLYPTHSIGGVLSVLPSHVVSVSSLGVTDRGVRTSDGIFDRSVSSFDNDFSNATALFELSDGGVLRTNEMRRVGYPSRIRESRFRFFGTEGSFEQLADASVWQDRDGMHDVNDLLKTHDAGQYSPNGVSYESGYARIQDVSQLPSELIGARNGHEGAHHFLANDFVQSVVTNTMPSINAWQAARYTLPGIVAHESAQRGGIRLPVHDFGDAPQAGSKEERK